MSFLLDTSVLSELVKKNPRPQVLRWIDEQDEADLFLSVLTIGELEKGVAKLSQSARKARLQTWVRRELAGRFSGRLLPVDARVASRWGALVGESERRGRPLPVIDSLLAATALVHDLRVVSRSIADFERCGVSCVDLWKE